MDKKDPKMPWKCRRGMLELDLLLRRYLDERYYQAAPEEQVAFNHLLDQGDTEIYAWLMGSEAVAEGFSAIVAQIRAINHMPSE